MTSFADIVWHKLLRRPYRLAAAAHGSGEPLVLLHGLGASGEVWQALTKKLDDNTWRVIVPDLLGFGDSPQPEWSRYSVDDHARAVLYTLKKAGISQPVTIVAHSMGCLVAAHLATLQPQKVKRLVLYAPPLFADEPDFRKHARKRERYFTFFEYVASHPQLIILQRRWMWRLAKRLAGLDLSRERWLPFERSLRNTIMEQRAYQELVDLPVPTDIIHGRLDFVVIRTEVDAMLKANKHITLHAVTGMHGMSAKAVNFIVSLLEAGEPKEGRSRT